MYINIVYKPNVNREHINVLFKDKIEPKMETPMVQYIHTIFDNIHRRKVFRYWTKIIYNTIDIHKQMVCIYVWVTHRSIEIQEEFQDIHTIYYVDESVIGFLIHSLFPKLIFVRAHMCVSNTNTSSKIECQIQTRVHAYMYTLSHTHAHIEFSSP